MEKINERLQIKSVLYSVSPKFINVSGTVEVYILKRPGCTVQLLGLD